ncbi:polysaccharide lyase family 7 protein [Glaciecola sp. 2405UD65-10]|uniref:polysaccharide lyase family 7 protein n=1 Tax=Glaciecola sp. 2405UD65-10 TaxID=3397244 RepID=UPI003B5A200E
MPLSIYRKKPIMFLSALSLTAALSACVPTMPENSEPNVALVHPSDVIDLSYWNITLPTDVNKDGKPDMVTTKDIQSYTHPNFFYVNAQNEVVFTSPNVAVTTANSKNARSELRHMSRGANTKIPTKAPQNNFALASHENANEFAAIGGKMEATLHVDHVAVSSQFPNKPPSYSVVIGQIHAGSSPDKSQGFGYGNEPLKIYYKKFPGHKTGSVFWTYERNLPKADPKRTDIAYPVWGNTWENTQNPGSKGIALGQEFSYTVNVENDIMELTFSAENRETVHYTINLANNVDAYGNVDEQDFENGYAGDYHYFKAGAYNQCNGGTAHPFWGTGCSGSGKWETDFANGDYTQVVFSKLTLSKSSPITQ